MEGTVQLRGHDPIGLYQYIEDISKSLLILDDFTANQSTISILSNIINQYTSVLDDITTNQDQSTNTKLSLSISSNIDTTANYVNTR